MVDLKTLSTISKIETGESPDALVYDSKHAKFTFLITAEVPSP